MKIEYRKNKLRNQLSEASEIKKAFGVNAKRVVSRLDDIRASPNLSVLMQIPAANCHFLQGNKKGQLAVNISSNFRLIFEISHNPLPLNKDGSIDTNLITDILILEIIDYH